MTYQLPERDLWPALVEHEIPGIPAHCRDTDVRADDHVAEKQPAADQCLVPLPRRPAHDIVVRRVEAERSSGQTISDEVDPQQLHRDQRLGHAERRSQEDGNDLANVGRDQVPNELLGVVVDAPALFDRALDGGKVVVDEHHVGGQLGDIRTAAHSYTNICLLESGCVVDAIAGHGYDLAR